MVTFNNAGRCGNFMFEFSAAYSYSLEYGLDFTIPYFMDKNRQWNPLYFNWFANPAYNKNKKEIHLWENGHHYQPLPFDESYRDYNIIVEGYRQSEKYFQKHRKEIIEAFRLPYEKQSGKISFHNRLGDYKQWSDRHHILTQDYITNSFRYFYDRGYTNIVVFSDGMEETKQYVNSDVYPLLNFEYSEGRTELEDIAYGASCEHNIIGASTFSWWQAWLNQNPEKIVISPVKWFEPKNSHLDSSDIVPESWIKM